MKKPKPGYKFCKIDGCYTEIAKTAGAPNVCPSCQEAEDAADDADREMGLDRPWKE